MRAVVMTLLVLIVVVPIGLLSAAQHVLDSYAPPQPAPSEPIVLGIVHGATPTTVPVAPVPTAGPVGPTDLIERIVEQAKTWLGVPYSWGGCTHHGVDCSCFVRNVWTAVRPELAATMPRVTTSQVAWATPVARADAAPGDLVFFDNTCTNCGANPTHVGLYLGGGMMIDAGDPVRIEPVYWGKLHSIGRVPS